MNDIKKDSINTEEKSKISVIFYIISILLFIISFLPILSEYRMWIYLSCIILSGYELIFNGIKNIFHFNFEEDTLMTIAVIAAFILGEFPESCIIVLLFRLGEFLEEKAVSKSNNNINNIVDIKAKTANLLNNEENIEIIDVEKLKIGDKILIKPGEMIPIDCKIISGNSNIDTANITGESKPVYVSENKKILSGTINLTGSLKCVVTKEFKDSTASQIVDLVYEATNNKGDTEKFITKFSKIYTPTVIIIAIIIAIFPSIILDGQWKEWILRSLIFLVASCPCSIVISIPLAFFSCIGAISKKGMLIKGTKHIESLANCKQIAFDKTGTITTGKMEIDKIVTLDKISEEQMLIYLYNLEKNSNHPISTAIITKVENEIQNPNRTVDNYEEISGHGIKGEIDNKVILFGNKRLLEKEEINITNIDNVEKDANYLVVNNILIGYITLKEKVRENLKDIVKDFKNIKIDNVIMLTGDNFKNATKVSEELMINEVYSDLLPQDKLKKVKELKNKGNIVFVGDGINDSPVLAESDFGISIGEGTEIANNTADGILISNNIATIPEIIKIARKTMRIVKFNIAFSLIIKAIVLILGVLGIAPVWAAIVADTGVSLITVLNCVRIFK